MQTKQLYFIALVCPEPLQGEITAIKNYFLEKYNCKVALKSPAHITLIPPFELRAVPKIRFGGHLTLISPRGVPIAIGRSKSEFLEPPLKHHNEDDLKKYLLKFKTTGSKISLSINGFGNFEKRTIFLQPENNDELIELQLRLQTYLKQKLFHIKDKQHFHPHITVANRDIKPSDFDEAWKIFQNKSIKASFDANHFSLLKLSERKWNVIAEFDLR